MSRSIRSCRFSLRSRASSSRSAVVSPVRPLRAIGARPLHPLAERRSRSGRDRGPPAPTLLPSSSTSRTAWALNSSVNCRRARRLLGVSAIGRDIVSTFRKMSTKPESPTAGRGGAPPVAAFKQLPAFCRVAATLTPSTDSDIKIEVWMPLANWNGKFMAVGNGGLAGFITFAAAGGGWNGVGLNEALERGYATASTDTGHTGNTAAPFLGHPEKLVDFAYRAVHEMTVTAKAIIRAFYDTGPRLSYWNGCSLGGRQGLVEAQRFPDDYDGIIAGAPAISQTRLVTWIIHVGHAALKEPQYMIPSSKYPMVHRAVMNACDALDGNKDGLIDDPRSCRFDFKTIECKGEDSAFMSDGRTGGDGTDDHESSASSEDR